MVSARAAPQIGITVLAAILFAQGLPARTFIAVLMYAQLSSIVASFFVTGIFGAKNSLGLQLALALLSSVWVLLDGNQPKYARAIALSAMLGAPYMLLSAGSEGALLTGFMAIVGSVAIFLLRRLQTEARIVLFWLGIIVALVALGIAFLSIDHLFDMFLPSIGKDTSAPTAEQIIAVDAPIREAAVSGRLDHKVDTVEQLRRAMPPPPVRPR